MDLVELAQKEKVKVRLDIFVDINRRKERIKHLQRDKEACEKQLLVYESRLFQALCRKIGVYETLKHFVPNLSEESAAKTISMFNCSKVYVYKSDIWYELYMIYMETNKQFKKWAENWANEVLNK